MRPIALLGHPVAHSLSPSMMNAAFEALSLPYVYLACDVAPENLPAAVAGLRALGFAGGNVTIPHKEAVLTLLDAVTPLAAKVGAVNTVFWLEGRLTGDNTDVYGFLTDLQAGGFLPTGKKALLLGAGGAARAVAVALAEAGIAALVISNRTLSRAETLCASLARYYPGLAVGTIPLVVPELADAVQEADLIVSTIPFGLSAPPTFPDLPLTPAHFIYDVVYSPPETPLLAMAKKAGAQYRNGLGMLIHQGAMAFTRWTGVPAPLMVFRTALPPEVQKGV